MSRSNHITNAFVAGEISPKAFGRTDVEQYNKSCEKLLNMIPYPQGGAGRRPGSIYYRDLVRASGGYAAQQRLIPFKGSDGSRWNLVITSDSPYRTAGVDRWKAVRVSDNTVKDITVYFSSLAGYPDFDWWSLGTRGIDLNEIQFKQAGNHIFLTHGDMCPIEIIYDDAGLIAGGFALAPFPNPFVYGAVNTTNRPMPMLPLVTSVLNSQVIRVKTRAAALTATIGATVDVSTIGVSLVEFDATWLGRVIKFSTATHTIVLYILSVTDISNAVAIITFGTLTVTAPTYYINFGEIGTGTWYELPAWNDELGWPRTCAFFETRIAFAGTETYGDTQWYSEVEDIYVMDSLGCVQDAGYTAPAVSSDAFDKLLGGGELDDIRWLVTGKNIFAGTNDQEYTLQSSVDSGAFGFDTYKNSAESSNGSAYQQAFRKEGGVLYLQKGRRVLREGVYDFLQNAIKSENLSILADHMATKGVHNNERGAFQSTDGEIVAMAVQEQPYGIIWCLDDNGGLIGLTRERNQQVSAWHYHELGGETQIGGNPFRPQIKSISVVENEASQGEHAELWMIVRRGVASVVAGVTVWAEKFFLEKLSAEWEQSRMDEYWSVTNKIAPVYMDCAVITNAFAQPTTSGVITGLPHGVGAVVTVICNGIYFGEYTVSSTGTIDISARLEGETNWQAIIGFNYMGDLIPVVPEVQAALGSSQGQPRRIDQITIHFYRSIGCRFGRAVDPYQDNTPNDVMEEVEFPDMEAHECKPFFTGEKKLNFPLGYESRPKIHIQSHLPFPCVVTHVVSRLAVYEG